MKTITVSDKSFEKIAFLIRNEIKGFEQQIRECKYILKGFDDEESNQSKTYYLRTIALTEKKKTESQKLLDLILSQQYH